VKSGKIMKIRRKKAIQPHSLSVVSSSSQNFRCLSTNPKERDEPGPLNHDEPCDSDVHSCAMPRGARARESGDRRGADAKEKPSPFCIRCVGIEKNSTSDGERERSVLALACSGGSFRTVLLGLACMQGDALLNAPSASLLNIAAGYRLAFSFSLALRFFDVVLSTTRKIFDPDLRLFSFPPKKKQTPNKQHSSSRGPPPPPPPQPETNPFLPLRQRA